MAEIIRFEDNWDFCFDAADSGVTGQWFRLKPTGTRKVSLPHLFLHESNPEGASIGFYFREFTLEKKDAVKRYMLRLHSAHPHYTVWLNGEQIGTRHFGLVSHDLDAGKAIKPTDKNLLVIRVQAPDKQGRLGEFGSQELPLGNPFQRGSFAGIPAPVELYTAGKAIIRSINVLPDFEADRITVELKFLNAKSFQTEAAFDITNPEGETGTLVKNIRLDKENGSYLMAMQLEGSKVWSPASPILYTLQIRMPGSPTVKVRFGMRGVEVDKGAFRLNHASFKVRGVGYPWFFNFHHGLPAHPMNIRAELTALKDAGFNLIRGFGAPLPPEVLDVCDEIGMMVLQETSAYNMKASKDGVDWIKAQLQALVERDGHHPCVFGWVVGSENGSLALENGNKLLRLTADLDPTRPVFSNLGSVHLDNQGGGKIDLGKVYEPVTAQIVPFEGHKLRLGYPLSRRGYAMLSNYCTSKDGKVVSDGIHGNKSYWERYNYLKDQIAGKVLADGLGVPAFGDLSALLEAAKKFSSSPDCKDLAKLSQELETGLKERDLPWKSVEAFLADADSLGRISLTRQINAMFTNTQISGYIIENAVDQGLRFTGLFDAMRAPKTGLLESLKLANHPVRVFAEAEERTPYSGSSASIKVHLFNEVQLGDYAVQFRVKGPNGRVLHQESLSGKAKPGLNVVGKFQFPVGFERGRFTFDLVLTRNGKELSRAEESFFVPGEVKLDNVLKKVTLLGNFPDTVSWSSTEDASVTVATGLHDVSEAALKRALDRASQGSTLILGALTEEDMKKVQSLKGVGSDLTLIRSAGGPQGNYHYITKSPAFKDLPGPGLMDEIFAEVQPLWSLDHLPEKTEVIAGSVNINTVPGAKGKIRWGADLALLPHGKGKVIFCQYDIFDRLGKNALADAMFANLVQLAK
jgi:beta-galactosidase